MNTQENKVYEKKFWNILEDLFAGAEVEGKSGYVNLLKVKRKYFKNYLKPNLTAYIEEKLKDFPQFKEELYQKLYSFFHRYFSETGSIYFSYTPLYYKIYDKVYKNEGKKEIYFKPSEYDYNTDFEQILSDKEDVSLFWKTHMLYYIKTDKIIRSMKVEFPEENLYFFFDASEIELKKANEKKQLIYELKEVSEDGTIVLKVLYSEKGKKTKEKEIIKQIKKANKYSRITEEFLKKAIKTFEKQANVDYFINKNAEKFLKEQFDLWMYQYLFSQEVDFDLKRFRQLQALKSIAYRIIEFIAQFEDELRKIWEKPRLVFNSNYVITLDRIAKKENGFEVIKEIISHLKKQEKEFKENLKELEKIKKDYKSFKERFENHNIKNQLEEWYLLEIIDENFKVDEVVEKKLHGLELNEKWQFLPIDTKYFDGLKGKIEEIFDIDEELDGRLIKSENWQALNTILPKYKEKIQTIYIDPPFNLGTNADFNYEVNYKDATWITMLENRISLAKELLNEKGSIFVRCDYNGNSYVKELLKIIFGQENYKNEILINRKRQSIGTPNKFEVESEYLYLFSKSEKFEKKDLYKSRDIASFKWTSFLKQEERNPRERVFLGKTLFPPKGQHFSLVQEKVDKLLKEHYLRLKCKNCGAIYYYDEYDRKGNFIWDIIQNSKERFKFLDIKPDTIVYGVKQLDKCLNCGDDNWKVEYLTSSEQKVTDNWKDIPSYEDNFKFSTENSEVLLKRVIQATSNKNDIVLDFFLGSGTTTAVAHKLKRKWIGIEFGEHFYTVILPRMKKVLFYDKSGISKEKDVKKIYNEKNAGGFFKYYELEQYEDILKTIDYADTDIKEYYEKLKQVLKENFTFSKASPFIFDKKLAKVVDEKGNINIQNLYPDKKIDIKESLDLANLGSNIEGIYKLLNI